MGRVVHFEVFGEAPQAQVDFYRNLFGWEVTVWDGPVEYHLVSTGPQSEVGINGAIAPFGSILDQRVVLTVDVADADAVIESATGAGATVVSGKHAVPGVGWAAYLRDPTGLVFGLMQADPTAGLPEGAVPPAGETAEGPASWDEVGERLRELGASLAKVVSETAATPQGQRVREEAERAAAAVRDAGRVAADKARPHMITALDKVSQELDGLAQRLRGAAASAAAEDRGEGEPGGGTSGEGETGGGETGRSEDTDMPSPEEQRPLA